MLPRALALLTHIIIVIVFTLHTEMTGFFWAIADSPDVADGCVMKLLL